MKKLKFIGIFIIIFMINSNSVLALECDDTLRKGQKGDKIEELQKSS